MQNLEDTTINLIVSERNCHGPYRSLADFTERVPVGREQLVLLIRLGALRFTGMPKSNLLWEAHLLLKKPAQASSAPALFQTDPKKFRLPELQHERISDAYDEIELLGFPVSVDAFEMLQTAFRGEIMAREMPERVGRKVRMTGRLVTVKYVYTAARPCP